MDVELCAAWATEDDACCEEAAANPTVYADMLVVASYLLFVDTGSKWPGVCNEIVRPCARSASGFNAPVWHGSAVSFGPLGSWGWQASWGSCGCGGARACSCSGPSEVTLGGFPIVSVNSVLVDGIQLDPAEYAVHDDGWLVRLPNLGETTPRTWPCCQRVDLPFSAEHTWAVDVTHGAAPPLAGVVAAAALACDFTLACVPGACSIPDRVASMARENTNYEFRVTDDPLNPDSYGNPVVDHFVNSVNPAKITESASVWSPDIGPSVRRVP